MKPLLFVFILLSATLSFADESSNSVFVRANAGQGFWGNMAPNTGAFAYGLDIGASMATSFGVTTSFFSSTAEHTGEARFPQYTRTLVGYLLAPTYIVTKNNKVVHLGFALGSLSNTLKTDIDRNTETQITKSSFVVGPVATFQFKLSDALALGVTMQHLVSTSGDNTIVTNVMGSLGFYM